MIGRYRRLRADLQRIRPRRIAAFAAALPGFFRQRITISQAEDAIKREAAGAGKPKPGGRGPSVKDIIGG